MKSVSHPVPSLRNRLLRNVLLPVAVMWLLATGLVVSIAGYFTLQAFDRALLDDAYAVASHVRRTSVPGDEGLELMLSSREISTVLFDQSESLFFAVMRPDGSLLAGHPGLRPTLPDATEREKPHFDAFDYQNMRLRTVTIYRHQPAEFFVVMAQTTLSRDHLMQRLFTFSIAPLLFLLGWLALWLTRSIDDDLKPLVDLEQAVEERDAHDLTPVAVSASTRDVQRLGRAINALFERIQHGVQAQREFSGNVAHELRTPLAGIRALADYGLRQDNPNVWREQLQGIVERQDRASHLIDQLLALALADESQQQLVKTPVALEALAQEAVMRYLPRADAAGVDLGADLSSDSSSVATTHAGAGSTTATTTTTAATSPAVGLRVMGHQALIEGVLNNLLDNALRYGLAASGERRITVSVKREPRGVVLSVADNGPGVSSEQMQHLTRRWVQGAAGEALKQGRGLGLAIVNEYARLMQAKVHLQAESPSGLRVSLVFSPVVG
jgi:two-component system sensor histidine kinase TctE